MKVKAVVESVYIGEDILVRRLLDILLKQPVVPDKEFSVLGNVELSHKVIDYRPCIDYFRRDNEG